METKRQKGDTGQPQIYTPKRVETKTDRLTLVTSMMKQDIIDAGTKFQIGGIPGHRVEGHLIVLKSFIQRRIKLNQGVVIQLVDFNFFFFLL